MLHEPLLEKPPRWQDGQIAFSKTPEKVCLKHALALFMKHKVRIPIFARLDEGLSSAELQLCHNQLAPFVAGFFLTANQITQLEQQILLPVYQIIEADAIQHVQLAKHIEGIVIDAPHQNRHDTSNEQPNSLQSLQQAVYHVKTNHPEQPVITSGCVASPADARMLKQAGADLMLLTEGYVKTGPGLPKRIHERLLYEKVPITPSPWIWSFLFGLAIFFGGIIALYFAFTSVILRYDEAFIGLSREQMNVINPRILDFMAHDRMSLAGTMISAGILYMALAYFGIRRQLHWVKISFHSAAISGFLGIFLFIGYGYFDWLHGLFWLVLLPIYALSWRESKQISGSTSSWHETNDLAWMRALYGQLLFVTLGFALLIGGLVISLIGVTKVFVATDITFICMSADMLLEVSDMLIPVIAHDRAGFGSALISVGILILTTSLWGFRAGERWLW